MSKEKEKARDKKENEAVDLLAKQLEMIDEILDVVEENMFPDSKSVDYYTERKRSSVRVKLPNDTIVYVSVTWPNIIILSERVHEVFVGSNGGGSDFTIHSHQMDIGIKDRINTIIATAASYNPVIKKARDLVKSAKGGKLREKV